MPFGTVSMDGEKGGPERVEELLDGGMSFPVVR